MVDKTLDARGVAVVGLFVVIDVKVVNRILDNVVTETVLERDDATLEVVDN